MPEEVKEMMYQDAQFLVGWAFVTGLALIAA